MYARSYFGGLLVGDQLIRNSIQQLLKIDTQKKTFLAVLLLFPTIQTENELTILCYTLTKL